MTNLDSILKSRDITLPTKVCIVKAMFFPVVMYGCESWTIKMAEHWRIDAFKLWCWRRLDNSLDSKEIKAVNPKGNQPWIFIGRTDAEAEAPVLWPPNTKSWLIGKNPDGGKQDWRQKEKGAAEDEMAKVLELQLQHQSFQWVFKVGFLYNWLVWSPCYPGTLKTLLQHHRSKVSVLWCSAFFMVQLSHPYMTTGKTIALSTKWCLCFLICCWSLS